MIELGLAWVWVWLVLVDVDGAVGAVGGVSNVWVVKRLIWKIIKNLFFRFVHWMNEWMNSDSVELNRIRVDDELS